MDRIDTTPAYLKDARNTAGSAEIDAEQDAQLKQSTGGIKGAKPVGGPPTQKAAQPARPS